MASRIAELVLDARDPELLAQFWYEVLGARPAPAEWTVGRQAPSHGVSSLTLKATSLILKITTSVEPTDAQL
ncbi:MAG TPA: hypothetical protein VI248_00450 [Kineosporiaceae bacterium]